MKSSSLLSSLLSVLLLAIWSLTLTLSGAPKKPGTPAPEPAAVEEKEEKKVKVEKQNLGKGNGRGGESYEVQKEDDSWKKDASLNPEAIRQAAERIDQVIDRLHKTKNVKAKPLVSDEVFVRRVYLDIAGRIPTYQEMVNFTASKDVNKRENLALALVQSEGYVNHFYNYWAGLLRIQSYEQGMSNRAYERWVKEALRANMPYDVFVRSLVTADGASTPDNGATGFILRDRRQGILDHVSQLSTVFLGSQIGCAMCHDAKFEKWKQKDFYAMTAYFSEMSLSKDPKIQRELRAQEKESGKTPAEIREIRKEMRESPYIITDRKGKEQTLPKDYQYDKALAGTVIKPTVLYGTAPKIESGETRRSAFARWLTSPENPNFTQNIANRLWASFFGIGLIEPLDDLSDGNHPASPELMSELTKTLIAFKYNMKAFSAAIAQTKAYQRETSKETLTVENFVFDSHPLRRMTAEQTWDSLFAIFLGERINQPGSTGSSAPRGDTVVMRTERSEMGQMSRPLAVEGEGKGMAMNTAMSGTEGKMDNQMEMSEEKAGKKAGKGKKGGNDYGRGLALSSDLSQPARPGTFLEQFGASLREIVSTGTTEPSIAQTLTLMNGRELGMVSQPGPQNALFANMQKAKESGEAVKVLYLSTLGRLPKEKELALIKEYVSDPEVARDKNALMSDLTWSVLNQREFLFYK